MLMKTRIASLLLIPLLFITSCGSSVPEGMQRLGSDSPVLISVPEAFLFEHAGPTGVFIMPRKNDMQGPISLKMTALRDLRELELPETAVTDFLKKLHPESKIEQHGTNRSVSSVSSETDPQGTLWDHQHFSIYVDGVLTTATISVIKGRENEPQVQELHDAFGAILTSLKAS